MRTRFAAGFGPFLALGALLAGCNEPNQPLSPTRSPQFSQTAANGAGKIAFQSDRDGDLEIFVMNADGSGVTQLTHNTDFDGRPVFSPDGTRLLFPRCLPAGHCDVMVINTDGTGERVVYSPGFPGAWSPDGNRIAFGWGDGVFIINADGSGVTRVADPQFSVADWSPDGRQLLLVLNFDLDIFVLNLDNNSITQLTNDPEGSGTGRWSPDGSRIAFNRFRDGPGGVDVFVMNSDGSGVTALTQEDGIADGIGEWSADGTQLVFSSNRDGDEEIFVMNADGTGPTQLTFNDGIGDGDPSLFGRVSWPNDDFANASVISTLPFSAVANLAITSVEADERTPNCATPYGAVSKSVWYRFVPADRGSISARTVNASIASVVTAYTGNSLADLSELGCNVFGGSVTFVAEGGTAYYFLVGNLFDQSGAVEFRLEVTPPPQANFGAFPSDPSTFDQVQFQDFSFDPAFIGFEPPQWTFGDGASGSGFFTTHRYAADGDYVVEETVTTLDGRSASTSRTLQVRTRDVAITRLQAPTTGMTGKTSRITVDIRSNRYPETVQVQLFKSVPGGFQLVATSTQTLPTRNRVTSVAFSYTFAPEDAIIGKVTFKAVASLLSGRDALPADNEAIAPPTRVNR